MLTSGGGERIKISSSYLNTLTSSSTDLGCEITQLRERGHILLRSQRRFSRENYTLHHFLWDFRSPVRGMFVHVLVQCVFAREVWFRCLRAARVHVAMPETTDSFAEWWLAARKPFGKNNKSFDTFVVLIAWSLWKQRNARLFNNVGQQFTVTVLVDRIVDEFKLWTRARSGGREIVPRE